jgi:glycosyltransferase involved in cell wall biosynthesis
VSDDGSGDDLTSALRAFRKHVRLVRGPNAGLAAARNRAANAATGELLALLDADDVWLPGRTDALMNAAAARPDLAILTTDAYESWDGVRIPGSWYSTRAFPVERQDLWILRESFIFGAGAVRAAVFKGVGGYRSGARYAEDWDLWMRLLLNGHRAGLIDQPLYEYRRREDSLSAQKLQLAAGVIDLLRDARWLAHSPEQRRQLEMTQQSWHEQLAIAAWWAHDPRARRMSIRAAGGRRARARARLRFGAAAFLPARVVTANIRTRSV